jgi:outer membrane lipoprotein-sorting protein
VIHKLTVKGQDSSVIVYEFEGEKKNQPLADSLFRFTAPPGVQIVDASK